LVSVDDPYGKPLLYSREGELSHDHGSSHFRVLCAQFVVRFEVRFELQGAVFDVRAVVLGTTLAIHPGTNLNTNRERSTWKCELQFWFRG
jgi:hypothetical protein